MPEVDIRAALETTVAAAERAPRLGPAEVFARAGRLQRRRRLTGALAGVATVAASITVGFVAAGQVWAPEPTSPAPQFAPGATTAAAPPRAVVAPEAVLAVLGGLLPGSATRAETTSERGFARILLEDQSGSGLVEVNVQPDFTDPLPAGKLGGDPKLDRYDCAKRQDSAGTACTATLLTDGTRVVTTDGPGDEPGVAGVTMRKADALGPDGTRVVVATWNAAPDPADGVTRASPFLTVQQVRDIAVSTEWRKSESGAPIANSGTKAGGGSGN